MTHKADPHSGTGASRVRQAEGVSVFGRCPMSGFWREKRVGFRASAQAGARFFGCDVWMEGLRGRIKVRKKRHRPATASLIQTRYSSYKPLVALKEEKVRRKTSDLRF